MPSLGEPNKVIL